MTPVRTILERQAKERADQMDADIVAVLATAPGRRLLMSMLHKGGVWARTGACDGNPVNLAYINGRRDAAADVLTACNRVASAHVATAMAENNERTQKWNEQIENAKQGEAEQ
jgi:hypothetical protein